MPVTERFDGGRFVTTIGGRRAFTPLFLTLLLVESADVLFAADSIPAIIAVTGDPFERALEVVLSAPVLLGVASAADVGGQRHALVTS
jgi:predicted tellurium resistance membrane protein TerC